MRSLAFFSMVLVSGSALADGTWNVVAEKDGIRVLAREVAGRDLPTFRGEGTIDANIYDVMAVISDISRHKEWVERCSDARLLRKENERTYVVYQRTDAPWPVADRDAVVRSVASVDLKRMEVTIRFSAIRTPLMGRVDGVVRMENLRGEYRLRAEGRARTRIEYEVDADPGGRLPRWIARLATKRLPIYTIRNLRAQVARTRGWYQGRVQRWVAGNY